MKRLPREFARACIISGLFFVLAAAQEPPASKAPLLVIPNADPKQWQQLASSLKWQLATPTLTNLASDKGIQDFQAAVTTAIKNAAVDPTRVYLVGSAPEVPAVFYLASRWPEPWAAAVALAGTPRPAIDTNRIFGANTHLVPLLWITGKNNEAVSLLDKLKAASYNVETRESATPQEIFAWLSEHRSEPVPSEIDCETDSPVFNRCYWIEMTKFDPAERNDVLTYTRVQAGSGASLDLGGFGFDAQAPGAGLLVTWLPEHYNGPLKLNDRIVSIGGKALRDAREYVAMMDQTTEEKPVAVMVERGKQRLRLETNIVLPKRGSAITARVQAQHLVEMKEIQVISRAVAQMKLTLSPEWIPAAINWNGVEVAKADAPGCWQLETQKELLTAKKCQ